MRGCHNVRTEERVIKCDPSVCNFSGNWSISFFCIFRELAHCFLLIKCDPSVRLSICPPFLTNGSSYSCLPFESLCMMFKFPSFVIVSFILICSTSEGLSQCAIRGKGHKM